MSLQSLSFLTASRGAISYATPLLILCSPRIPYVVDAELGIAKLALTGPKDVHDIEAFAETFAAYGASVR